MAYLGTAASGKVAQGEGTNPASFSTATYPATAGTALNLLQSDGTNFVSTAPIWQVATHTLLSSEIKNLHGTPIQLIAAPGSGKGIVVFSAAAKLNYGGNNGFTGNGSNNIALFYNNTTLAAITPIVSNAMVISTANKFQITPFTSGSLANQAAGVLDNTNIALYNSIAAEFAGNAANDNTIDVYVTYTIVTF